MQAFWNVFTLWWFGISGEYLTLSIKDIMVGLLQRNDLLNYLIILGKLTIWECRKNNTSPIFSLFLHKVEVKKQVEKIIAIRNRTLLDFQIRCLGASHIAFVCLYFSFNEKNGTPMHKFRSYIYLYLLVY